MQKGKINWANCKLQDIFRLILTRFVFLFCTNSKIGNRLEHSVVFKFSIGQNLNLCQVSDRIKSKKTTVTIHFKCNLCNLSSPFSLVYLSYHKVCYMSWNRSLGAFRLTTSSWRPIRPIVFVLRTHQRPTDPCKVDQHLLVLLTSTMLVSMIQVYIMHESMMNESMIHPWCMYPGFLYPW